MSLKVNSRYMLRNTLELPPEPELASALLSGSNKGLKVLVAASDSKANEYYSALQSFYETIQDSQSFDSSEYSDDVSLLLYPALDVLPFEMSNPSSQVVFDRVVSKSKLVDLDISRNHILVTSLQAFFEKVESPKQFKNGIVEISVGIQIAQTKFVSDLISLSYNRRPEVEEVGYYADHGSVVDVFSPNTSAPFRFEFYGGKLSSIRVFDPANQRSIEQLDSCIILPVLEAPLLISSGESENYWIEKYRSLISHLDVSASQKRFHEECLLQERVWPGSLWLRRLLLGSSSSLLDYLPETREIYFLGDLEVKSWNRSWQVEIDKRFLTQDQDETYVTNKEDFYFDLSDVEGKLESEFLYQRYSDELPEDIKRISRVMPELLLSADASQKSFHAKALDAIKKSVKEYKSVILTCSTLDRAEGIHKIFKDEEFSSTLRMESLKYQLDRRVNLEPGVTLIISHLSRGFILEDDEILVVSEKDLFGNKVESRRQRKYPYRKANFRAKLSNLRQLSPGDYVVHEMYGVGVFLGLKNISYQGEEGEYLEVEYYNSDKLFVPVHDFLRIGKYAGPEGRPPILTKLGAGQWEIQKKKVRDNLLELTSQLLKTVAVRSITKGLSFDPFGEEERLFADQFEYDETTDQLKAIEAVLGDMESDRPMDRLVCGDVGFGKTEVAMRAAFKAINSGKQVAMLVPTTILADQHGRTFHERFASVSVQIEVLSRFYTPKRNLETLQKVAKGDVDIVIGTHRLIQSDVSFKNLGLLIIDEEHRFGVAQKEKLKALRAEVDVLSLSATPIPRTLQMALFGTRDLSVIETAPVSRQVIQTVVREFEENAFRDAILKEVSRGGQVYVVHHFISELEALREQIVSLIPEIKIAVVHGRIKKTELENTMHGFYEGKFQVLLATHIIESGLDVANANTMIIVDPELFGLAQLYQLRGRVGRSSTKAYAYLLYKNKAKLSSDALRRLDAMSAIDELGVGFRLALQDMEIRGAGTMLGKDQSGHVQILGYEMYLKILEEAVRIERARREGGKVEVINFDIIDPELKLGVYPSIPKEYIYETEERVVLYQKACYLNSREEGQDFLEELEDRYGRYTHEIVELVEYMIIKNKLRDLGIFKAVRSDSYMHLHFKEERTLSDFMLRLKEIFKPKRELMRIRILLEEFSLGKLIDVLGE
jgi:transcription-repair coupling factor (superfamily II helicase)